MKPNVYYEGLLVRFLDGTIQPEELSQLEEWKNSSDDNTRLFEAYVQTSLYAERLVKMRSIDINKDREQVKRKLFGPDGNKVRSLSWFYRASAVFVIPLFITTALLFYQKINFSGDSATNMLSAETAYGVRTQIELSDGSRVWLNSGSKLTYPAKFNGNVRCVKLTGEGYFHVKSDKNHPFYVDLGPYSVKATGTSFNISNYYDDKKVSTMLEKGKVTLVERSGEQEKELCRVTEGELAAYDKEKQHVSICNGMDNSKYLAWVEGKLVFRNDPMEEVISRLGRWFNVDIEVKDVELKGYFYTATFINETIDQVLDLLTYSAPIKYTVLPREKGPDDTFSKRKIIITKRTVR